MTTSSSSWSLSYQIFLAVAFTLSYLASFAIYRLYFHPLSKFPGPKLAALTSWYACYYDLFVGGQYIWVIEDMHARYGPIVRIRPDVLHVNDPAFIDKLYTSNPKQRRERYKTLLRCISGPGSILGTKDHDLHRNRRAVIAPFFSKSNVRRLEPVVNNTLANLLRRLHGWAKTGEVVQLNAVFRAATKDVIHAYAFGEGEKFLEMEDCNREFFNATNAQRFNHIATHFHWMIEAMKVMPPKVTLYLYPSVVNFARFVENIGIQIDQIRTEPSTPKPNSRTIFHEILQNTNIPPSEKLTPRLREEAFILVVAGSETTATTLTSLFYHILSTPKFFTRLRTELETIMPDPNTLPDGASLETLPFLNALVSEALRLYPGATHRQDRVAPDEDLPYTDPSTSKTYIIPRGSAVGMTAPLINRHPSIYTNPSEFDPDRYLRDPKLSRQLFSFGRGARQCVGMYLAYQELLTFTAGVFRRYGVYDAGAGAAGQGPTIELWETGREDVDLAADFITLGVREGSLGVRVRIREERVDM